MKDNRVALVTGANQGIGLQIAKDLAAAGLTVLVGARDLASGEAAAQEIDGDAEAIQIDVTDAASIAAAASQISSAYGRLDVLVNNAGITGMGSQPGKTPEEMAASLGASVISLDNVREVFETNTFAPLAVAQAMIPLLREAPAGRIVNVSSSVGSLTGASDPAYPYRSIFGPSYAASKTAFNAMTVALAIDLEKTNIKVNAICPGYVATNLNNYSGHRTVEQGAAQAVKMALIGPEGPTGTFTNEAGVVNW